MGSGSLLLLGRAWQRTESPYGLTRGGDSHIANWASSALARAVFSTLMREILKVSRSLLCCSTAHEFGAYRTIGVDGKPSQFRPQKERHKRLGLPSVF